MMTLKKDSEVHGRNSQNKVVNRELKNYISINSKWQIQGIHIFDFEIYPGATSTKAN
jgi:hypothetical protein